MAPPVVVGAPADAQYYYLPEANAYYDVPGRRYLVRRKGQWVRHEHLGSYDARNFHPQHLDYRGAKPWTYKRDGNPHGLPPGQARKMYCHDDHGPGHDKDKGHGHPEAALGWQVTGVLHRALFFCAGQPW